MLGAFGYEEVTVWSKGKVRDGGGGSCLCGP